MPFILAIITMRQRQRKQTQHNQLMVRFLINLYVIPDSDVTKHNHLILLSHSSRN